jgi:hypothetical protein
MKQNINCPCGNNLTAEYEEEVDLDSNPQELDKILNGYFMSYDCSGCDKRHKPEYKIMILWNSKKLKLQVLPEFDRGEFYRNKENTNHETVIGFPEMADRLAVIKDNLEPIVVEAIKSFLYAKAEESYPDKDVNVRYYCKGAEGIEFHIDGIRDNEVAVMRVPLELYEKTKEDYRKQPKSDVFAPLQVRSYLSVQNILRHDLLK